jgi:putative transcriptional regulator
VKGIYWGGHLESLLRKLNSFRENIRNVKFILGYSGWGAGQLAKELKTDSWIVSDHVTPELVFETDHQYMWQSALKTMGGRFSVYSNYPVDPNLN